VFTLLCELGSGISSFEFLYNSQREIVNAKVTCSDTNSLFATENFDGSYGEPIRCPPAQLFSGFQVGLSDTRTLNNVKGKCKNSGLTGTAQKTNNSTWEKITECPNNKVITGISARIPEKNEPLINLRVYCEYANPQQRAWNP